MHHKAKVRRDDRETARGLSQGVTCVTNPTAINDNATSARRAADAENPRLDMLFGREVREFFQMYHLLTARAGLGICQSVPLEIVLNILVKRRQFVTEAELQGAINATLETIMRWARVLVSKGLLVEATNHEGAMFALSPETARHFLFDI